MWMGEYSLTTEQLNKGKSIYEHSFVYDGLSFTVWVSGPPSSLKKEIRQAEKESIENYQSLKNRLIRKVGKGFEVIWLYFRDDEIPHNQLLEQLGVFSLEEDGNYQITDWAAIALNPRSAGGMMHYFTTSKYADGYAASQSFRRYKILRLKVVVHPGK